MLNSFTANVVLRRTLIVKNYWGELPSHLMERRSETKISQTLSPHDIPVSLVTAWESTRIAGLFDRLRVLEATDKVEGPATCNTFLGTVLDSEQMILWLPEDKLQSPNLMEAEWLGKKLSTVWDLQSLVGKLQHASKVVRPGRTVIEKAWAFERLWEEEAVCKAEHIFLFRSHVVAQVLRRMEWYKLLGYESCLSMIHNPAGGTLDVHLYSNASNFFGCEA